jgi:site-specific DNA-methyltransferase (adenine-specific)
MNINFDFTTQPGIPVSLAYNVDCMLFMKHVPDQFFNLVVADIPYGIGVGKMAYLKETNTKVKQKNGSRLNPNTNKKPYTLKEWDENPPPQEYFDELRRVSKDQIIFGIEYVNWTGVGNGRIRWDKGVPDGMSFKRYEIAYCSLIEDEVDLPLLWAGMQQAKSLSEPMVQQGDKKKNEKRIHPCHKPELLYQRILLDYSKPGFKIYDSHLGAGSIRIVCDKMGLDFWGNEIDKEYYDLEEERYRIHKLQYTLY